MKQESKFTQKEQQKLSEQHQTEQEKVLEFANPEDMLRHDTRRTPVPPAIGDRLRESLNRERPQPSSWWRRWLGGDNKG